MSVTVCVTQIKRPKRRRVALDDPNEEDNDEGNDEGMESNSQSDQPNKLLGI